MMMSEREICFRFKRNGCHKKHVKILAELNDHSDTCSRTQGTA